MTPAGTPSPIIDRLNKELREILQLPEVKERLATIGVETEFSSSAEATAYFLAHRQKITSLLKKLNLSITN
jgi:tripartite-type tricarboxylate transporter receptor subunit TctC